jgi:hypothetical protein
VSSIPTESLRVNDLANDVKVYLNPRMSTVTRVSSPSWLRRRAIAVQQRVFVQHPAVAGWDRNYTARAIGRYWGDMLKRNMGGGTMGTASVVSTIPI